MSQDTYKKETETVPFQGKNITLVNYTPILSLEQREKLNLEIEQRLYEIFIKYRSGN